MSRVIKKGSLKGSSICNVNYEALIGAGMEERESPPAYLEADGFKPLFFNEHLDVAEHDEEDAEATETDAIPDAGMSAAADIPDGMLYIAEEDLQTQLTEAYQRGVEEGRQAAERGLAHVFRALRDGADSLVSLREKVLRDSECDLLKLSSLVAKKIILQEIALDPAILGNIVAATVSCCSEQDRITIRLSPDDYKAVMADRQSFSGVLADEGRVTLAPDDSIMLGGCLVETPTGTVDARIESQLDEVFARCMEQRGIPQESLIVNSDGEQVL